jgi:WD40 repeat protein
MSRDEGQPPDDAVDELLAGLLAAYDERRAAGCSPEPATPAPDGLEAGCLGRLRVAEKVLARLERAWPRTRGDPDDTVHDRPAPLTPRVGRFRVLRELGRGGFGIVYLAADPRLGRQVALKVPRPEALLTPDLRRRFLREARAAAGLDHPNIVPVFDSGEAGAACYLVSAYCRGGTLAEHLKARPRPLPARDAAALVAALADAVEHAHRRGILHRDIKPGNVLLDPPAEGTPRGAGLDFIPRLTDFGLARFLETEDPGTPSPSPAAANDPAVTALTTQGAVMGTPEFMAPEQAAGRAEAVSAATDVYGLGALLYAVLTFRPPFAGKDRADLLRQVIEDEPAPPCSLCRGLPRDLEAVCVKCLEKDPARRYASAAEMAEDLRRFLADEPTRARPAGAVRRLVRWARRRPSRNTLIVLALLAAVAVPAGLAWYDALERAHDADLEEAARREAEQAAKATQAQGGARRERQWRYAMDLGEAWRAWEGRQYRHAADLLARQEPAAGEDDLRGFEWYLLTGMSRWRCPGPERFGHGIAALALSPDGKELAVSVAEGDLELWDTATWQKKAVRHVSLGALAYSPDGKILAAGGGGDRGRPGWIKLLHRHGLTADLELAGPPASVIALAFGPDGRRLFSVSNPLSDRPGEVRMWDVAGGRCLAVGHAEPKSPHVSCLAWFPAWRAMACGYDDGSIGRLDGSNLTRGARLPLGPPHVVLCMAASPDGKRMAVGVGGGVALVGGPRDGPPRELLGTLPGTVPGWALAWDPGGSRLAVGYLDGSIALWDTAARELLAITVAHRTRGQPPEAHVRGLAFLPGGRRLVSAGADGALQVWDPDRPQPMRVLARDLREAWWVAFSPDGRHLFAGGDDGTARRWDVRSGRQELVFRGHGSLVGAGAVSPDGKLLATGGWDQTVRLWDAASGQPLRTLRGHWAPMRAVAFSPDGRSVASCGSGAGACWDRATGKLQWQLGGKGSPDHALAFHPRRAILAAGAKDHMMKLWDAAHGTLLQSLPEATQVRSLAYSPDGAALAVGMEGGTVKLRRGDGGETLWSHSGHGRPVRALAFSPDGRTLASGGEDGQLKLWHAATGQELLRLAAYSKTVSGLAFSPDGQTLAVAVQDGTVRLWLALGEKGHGGRRVR